MALLFGLPSVLIILQIIQSVPSFHRCEAALVVPNIEHENNHSISQRYIKSNEDRDLIDEILKDDNREDNVEEDSYRLIKQVHRRRTSLPSSLGRRRARCSALRRNKLTSQAAKSHLEHVKMTDEDGLLEDLLFAH